MNKKKKYFTVKELADMLGVSRIAVFNRIKKGQIPAEKIGRNFVIFKKKIPEILGKELSDKTKKEIDRGVKKVIKDYSETLKLLGKE